MPARGMFFAAVGKLKAKLTEIVLFSTSMADVPIPACKCSPDRRIPVLVNGWEGSAILYHGALLRFGCHAFVFTIVDYDEGEDEFDDSYQDSDSDE